MTDVPPGAREQDDADLFVRQLGFGTNVVRVRGEWASDVRLDVLAIDGRQFRIHLPSAVVYQMLEQLPELLVQAAEDVRRRMNDT